jgi:MFS family permease
VISVFCYGLAGSSGLFLNEIGWILLGRLVLGLSVAGTMTTATTLIADYYLGAARAQFLGFQAASIGLGGVFVLTLGGYLADISWRLPFLLYAVAWLLVPLVVLVLPEPERRSPAETMPLEVASPERMPWALVMTTFAIALLVQIAFYMIPTQLPFYLQRLTNTNGSQTGLAIALTISAAATSSLNYQRLKARLTFAAIYALGFGLMGTGYLVISQAPSYGTVAIGLAIAGLGLGLFSPNMTVWLTSSTPAALRGRILGGLTTSFFLGQFVSPLVSQPLSQRLGMAATYGLAGGLLLMLGGISLGVMAH